MVAIQCIAAGRVAHHDAVHHKFTRFRQVDNHLHIADIGSIGWLEVDAARQGEVVTGYDAGLVHRERCIVASVVELAFIECRNFINIYLADGSTLHLYSIQHIVRTFSESSLRQLCQVVDGVEQSAAAHRHECIGTVGEVADGQRGISIIVCLHQLTCYIVQRPHHRCIACCGKRGLNLS